MTMPDQTGLLLEMVGLLMAIGGVAGILAGLLGVGGGIVLVAAFFYAFQQLGYDNPQLMQICLATSLATIIVTSIRSVLAHNKRAEVDWDILRGWAPGLAVGSAAGVLAAASLGSTVLQMIFGALGMIVGLYMALGRAYWRLGQEVPKGLAQTAYSGVVGFLSVLMGIGGGAFGVTVLSLHNTPMHRAVATAAGFGVLIAVPSVLGFLFVSVDPAARPPWTIGAVNIPAFLVVISMTLLTTPLGVRLAHTLNPGPLKRIFAVFLILVACNMLRKALGS